MKFLTLVSKGGYSDLVFKRISDKSTNEQELFKIYDSGDTYASIYLYGNKIGESGVNGGFYPSGKWDFRNAEVKGITITFG